MHLPAMTNRLWRKLFDDKGYISSVVWNFYGNVVASLSL
jgi:hypothetical protein